jgi:hypothetical protein
MIGKMSNGGLLPLRQVNMLRVVIPGLTRNPVPSWMMNIKLRFPASAGMTVLMYMVAGAIISLSLAPCEPPQKS